jgi:hypothetical protein
VKDPPAKPTADLTPYEQLSDRERDFVDAYLTPPTRLNKTAAARAAGYKKPGQAGWRLYKKVEIRAAIQERLAASKLTPEELIAHVEDIATFTAADFLTFELVEPAPAAASSAPATPAGAPDSGTPESPAPKKPPRYRAKLDLVKAARRGKLGLIRKIKETKEGALEVEFYDKQSAQRTWAAMHGLLKGKVGDLPELDEDPTE